MARILVADDNARLLDVLTRVLEAAGHRVEATNNGSDALVRLAAHPPPDVAILDVQMPGMTGPAVLAAMGPAGPPVILITGGEMRGVAFDPLKVSKVLFKVFDLDDILAAVNDALCVPPPAADPT